MTLRDLFSLALAAVTAHRLRSALSMVGIAIGIAAVLLLTSIGEGTRRYILSQFTQFGTNILAVNPGKTKTVGIPGVLGGTTHKLTLDDAEEILRLPGVECMVPLAMGTARVEAGERGRSVYVYGVNPDVPAVWKIDVRVGRFWARGDPHRGTPVALLGPTLKRELFGDRPALGQFVRIAETRFRVIGVMAPKGRMLGFDIDDAAYIPVATAMRIFNLDELLEIDVLFAHAGLTDQVAAAVRHLLTERHNGNEDFTITTQTAMLEVLGNVMDVITLSVGAIAAISLLVGAIGILTMMWIAVRERTGEIGLVRALGATRGQVQLLFLAEASALSTAGGAVGLAVGLGAAALLRTLVPGLPVETPPGLVVIALVVSVATGLIAGVWPARRAATLDPVEALREE